MDLSIRFDRGSTYTFDGKKIDELWTLSLLADGIR
jgi:hypothetical protein